MIASDDDMMRQLSEQWQAAEAPAEIAPDKLRRKLRRQQWLSRLNVASEVLLIVGSLVFTIMGFERFGGALGSAMIVFITFAGIATVWARWGREQGDVSTVAGMIDLTIARARKSLRWVHASYLISIAALLLIAFIMFVVSSQPHRSVSHEWRHVWFVGVVLYTVIFMVGLRIYERVLRRRLQRFEEMRAALRPHADAGAGH